MKMRFIKSIILSLLVMAIISGCGKAQVNIPSEITDGYMVGDYDIYKEAAKVNGRKYDKLYVVGKFSEEPFEESGVLQCYLVDENNKKYLLKLDAIKTEYKDDYKNLQNKQICVCGVYIGSLKKEPMPVIGTNKIYDIEDKKTIVSQYYGEYYGDFDENGKVVSTDYDKDDNTTIDFHSIQLQVPYNYMENTLNDTVALYQIHDDGAFYIIYEKSDMSATLMDFIKKIDTIENIKKNINNVASMYESMFGTVNISNAKEDTYNCTISYNITNGDMDGNGVVILRNDGMYLVTLLTDKNSRFNRTQDFSKILKSLKTLNPARQPKSTGINKMTVPKNTSDSSNNNTKVEEESKTSIIKESTKMMETTANRSNSNNEINDVIEEYKKDIDDAKSELNNEIDKAADELKDEMGIAGDLFGGYIDEYSDAYKKAIDTVGDTYKDVADDYGKTYQDILNGFKY